MVLCVSALSFAARAEHTGILSTDENEKIQVLQLLEIMNGDENGDLNFDKAVTRAEFVKMAISASSYKDSVDKSVKLSAFPDVTSTHWASGYVVCAIKNGLVTGYLDGTFKPENTVKLEEAVMICLKLLGYTSADFGASYPEAQLEKYKEISLDTGISATRGQVLTRHDCMKLIYNLLCTKTKQGAYYCTTLGYTKSEDNTIEYLSLLSEKMKGPVIVSDLSYKNVIPFDLSSATILFNGQQISASTLKTDDVLYYAAPFKTIWVYRDTVSGVCTGVSPDSEKPTSVTVGGKNYSLSTDKAAYKFSDFGELGKDVLVTLILGKDGSVVDAKPADASVIGMGEDSVEYSDVVTATLKGPYIAKSNGKLLDDTKIILENAVVYKNNKQAEASDIKAFNVYYYSQTLNTVWVYDKTVSGTLESVSPSAMSPTSVTVSGNTYTLETSKAKYDFSTLGTYVVGDRVTLLLGKDGNVAGVTDTLQSSDTVYGVVIANGDKKYTDANGKSYTADTVSVFTTAGETFTYESSSTAAVGRAVKVSVSETKVSVSTLSSPKNASAAAEVINAVKYGKFANNCEIIEYYNSNLYSSVFESRISGLSISYTDIIYYKLNSDGEIEKLILDNVTGDLLEYGLLTEVNGSTYKYIIDGEEQAYSSGDVMYTVSEGVAYFAISGNKISKIGNIGGNVKIETITANKAYTEKGKEYGIADKARVYVTRGVECEVYDAEDFDFSPYSHITGYYDDLPENGGKIRVFIVY